MHAPSALEKNVLSRYGLADAALTPMTMGHINVTYRVDAGQHRFILQRLNQIFDPELNEDIDALTQRLASAGLTTPRLVRTEAGASWVQSEDGRAWRLLTFVPGQVFATAAHADQCRSAGALLGQFHRALAAKEHIFAARRLGVHDTARHLGGLHHAVRTAPGHPAHATVARMADDVDAALAQLMPFPSGLPQRIVHGDPKMSNVVFADGPANGPSASAPARAFIDLDTLAPMEIPLELGDAMRSWCNPAGEGTRPATFSLAHLEAGLQGYAQGSAGLLGSDEIAAIAPGIGRICLELCARFLRDALEECYFSWDAQRYQHAHEHHLVRACSQWACWRAYLALGDAPSLAVERAFSLTA